MLKPASGCRSAAASLKSPRFDGTGDCSGGSPSVTAGGAGQLAWNPCAGFAIDGTRGDSGEYHQPTMTRITAAPAHVRRLMRAPAVRLAWATRHPACAATHPATAGIAWPAAGG